MCRIASLFSLQRLKENMSGDARDFNNIETRAVKFFSPLQGKAPKKFTHNRMPPSKTGWPSLNVVIFSSAMRIVLDEPKQ